MNNNIWVNMKMRQEKEKEKKNDINYNSYFAKKDLGDEFDKVYVEIKTSKKQFETCKDYENKKNKSNKAKRSASNSRIKRTGLAKPKEYICEFKKYNLSQNTCIYTQQEKKKNSRKSGIK
tara:strand:+ start:6638 stop:6997 length:360 start_codon:yes stop_codon:yes gene_type:complete